MTTSTPREDAIELTSRLLGTLAKAMRSRGISFDHIAGLMGSDKMAREALVRGQWFPSPDVPGTYLARKGSGKLAELVPVETLAVIGDIVQDCMPA